ncbi:MAG: Si-specific NAD(P)(+) transhydrogenase, partial [Longimicrobiales bacterium]
MTETSGVSHYDLIVIGGGPAGEKGAAQAAYFGKRVLLIEELEQLGGAAANTGTLPSKTLRETSLTLSGLRARSLYGVDLSLRREATVADLLYREQTVVGAERVRADHNVKRHGITLVRGRASFVAPNHVRMTAADGDVTSAQGDIILIATGSSPRRPPAFPFDHPSIYDSDTILSLRAIPERMAVVGGGVIGCEYACTFAALGCDVTLIDGGTRLLGFLDVELSAALRAGMEQLGIRMVAPARVQSCRPIDASRVTLDVGNGVTVDADAVLVAAGRTSNTASLGVAEAGIITDESGRIDVDQNYRTCVPHIYAAGDVIGFPALASTSMEQARLAMVHAFDLKYKTEFAPILPYGIYTIPELSMAGETEETLQKAGIPYVVGRAEYNANARGLIIGDRAGFVKLLYRADDMKLVGTHIIGEMATEILHIGLTAMLCNATADLFIRMCFNYPT